VSEVANLISRLRADPSDKTAQGDLATIVKNVQNVFEEISKKLRNREFSSLTDVLETEGEMGLTRFFSEVSRSLVDAQRELDRRSLEYVRELDPLLSPAYYAIPNLKTEMKVGFSHIGQKGMNLVLFNKSDQKQQYAESSVTFELAATPPPPGHRAQPILVTGNERDGLLKRVLALIEKNEEFNKIKLENKVFENPQEQVVLLRYRRQPAGTEGQAYLALWPARRKDDADWRELLVMGLVDRGDVLVARDDLFEDKQKYVRVAETKKTVPQDPAQLATGLADATVEMARIINDWLNPEA
jgi:hypothetical protein